MAKFADDCMSKMQEVARDLEVDLPGTSHLVLRIGMHAGPVTAGVMRGQRSRFQLFGDTVNTAARMESNGCPGRIQCSQTAAALLEEAGNGHWLRQREKGIEAKGKGQLATYWVSPKEQHSSSSKASHSGSVCSSVSCLDGSNPNVKLSSEIQHLVDWNVDILMRLLKRVVAGRTKDPSQSTNDGKNQLVMRITGDNNPRDEYSEVISLPRLDRNAIQVDPDTIVLEKCVEKQIRDFVSTIACAYHDNRKSNVYCP
jgi:hypothetical protein